MASCCRCTRPVGPNAMVQPTNVDGEIYCPPCFVTRRMREEPGRFNATQACAATCAICRWETVSFGAIPGQRLRCGHCLRFTARKLDFARLPLLSAETRAIEELARESGMKDPQRLPKSGLLA